jgi:hypothetical protein
MIHFGFSDIAPEIRTASFAAKKVEDKGALKP